MDPKIVKKTQDSLGKIIKKPPLTEKLLNKPPFRFLHDIVTSVIKTTGFMQGLFTDSEMNSENVKDKDAKIAFLQKAIDMVSAVTGKGLTVKPVKVVAGHEPEKTNEFLQALADAINKNVDNDDYVKRVLKGGGAPVKEERKEKDRTKSADRRKAKDSEEKESREEKKDEGRSRDRGDRERRHEKDRGERRDREKGEREHRDKGDRERESKTRDKSRDGGREERHRGGEKSRKMDRLDGMENSPKNISSQKISKSVKTKEKGKHPDQDSGQTQAMKPEPERKKKAKTESLEAINGTFPIDDQGGLEKTSVNETTRNRDECKTAANDGTRKREDSKTAWKADSRKRGEAKMKRERRRHSSPSRRMVTGAEEDLTDAQLARGLQYRPGGDAVDSKLPCRHKSGSLAGLDTFAHPQGDVGTADPPSVIEEDISPNLMRDSSKEKENESPARVNGEKQEKQDPPSRLQRPASAKGSRRRREGPNRDAHEDEEFQKPSKEPVMGEDDLPPQVAAARQLARPSSARPAPPRPKQEATETEPAMRLGTGKPANLIVDDDDEDDDENFLVEESAPPPPEPDMTPSKPTDEDDAEHGALVKKMLESKKELEGGSQNQSGPAKKTEIERPVMSDAQRRKQREQVQKEVDRLRASIQGLTRSANPLGKVMDYVQEDLDSMQQELDRWKTENAQHALDLKREMNVTDRAVEPLRQQLTELDRSIADQLDQIAATKANIIKNDQKIGKMLRGIASS